MAFFADAERSAAVRRFALAFACIESAIWCFSPVQLLLHCARAPGIHGLPWVFPAFEIALGLLSNFLQETVPLLGGGSFTPARRAFESPMAIVRSVERAPCFPSKMCSISSCTNSLACVNGGFHLS